MLFTGTVIVLVAHLRHTLGQPLFCPRPKHFNRDDFLAPRNIRQLFICRSEAEADKVLPHAPRGQDKKVVSKVFFLVVTEIVCKPINFES